MRWADAGAAAAGMSAYDSHLQAARAAEREKLGFHLFGAPDRYLLLSSPPIGKN